MLDRLIVLLNYPAPGAGVFLLSAELLALLGLIIHLERGRMFL